MSLKLYILMTMCLATLLFHTANGQGEADADSGKDVTSASKLAGASGALSTGTNGRSVAADGASKTTPKDIEASTDPTGSSVTINPGATTAKTTGGSGTGGSTGSARPTTIPKVTTPSSDADVVNARFSILTLGALALGALA